MSINEKLCKYRHYFGKEGNGVHSYRIFNIAIVDVLATILVAFFVSYFFRFPFLYCLAGFFLLGIIFHRLFCVRTTIDKLLFP